MKNQNKNPLLQRPAAVSVLASLLSIVIGLVLGFVLLVILNPGAALGGMTSMMTTGFSSLDKFAKVLYQAAPLMMCGLSVGFAFKTGLFNIGASGQYTMGAFFALLCAIQFQLPWFVCLLAGAVGGAIWGVFPGLFKAYFNVNEVITAIMFNWIGLYAVNPLIYQGGNGPMFNLKTTKTFTLKESAPQALLPTFNVNVGGRGYFGKLFMPTIGIFIAIGIAVLIWVVINKTTFGYQLKACGFNKNAARYAGINEKTNIVLSMTIAGALAGIGAGLFYLSGSKEWEPLVSTILPAVGFNGISVALLASSNPIGCVFSAIFISHITVGGGFMTAKLFPSEVSDIISGVVIYLCAFSMLFRGKILKLFNRKSGTQRKGDKA